ncbi:MAG: hypothetical protein OXU20_27230 [Myxococcales bacterium]|nr:hypothetical protein [Myxococcales bacterium]
MSYLDWPRLHFKGRFQADTSTVNNDVRHYKSDAFEPQFQAMMVGHGQGQGQAQRTNGYWNPEGSGAWRLVHCRITSAVLASKTITSARADPVVGMRIAGSDDRVAGKLVDLDPQQQAVSQIWGLRVALEDDRNVRLFDGHYDVGTFSNLWKRQQIPANFDQTLAAAFQSQVNHVQWSEDLSHSEALSALRAACNDGPLSICFNTFGFDREPSAPDYTTGVVAGTIGPATPAEPKHFVLGRQLVAPLRDGNPTAPLHGVYSFTCVVHAGARVLSADMGNCLPILHADGTLQDVGELSLAVAKRHDVAAGDRVGGRELAMIGTIPYQRPLWYERTAGVIDLPYGHDGWLSENIGGHPVLLVRAAPADTYDVLVRETADGLYVRADSHVCRLNPGQAAEVTLYGTRFGTPHGMALSLSADNSLIGGAGTGATLNPERWPVPDVGVPASALSYPATLELGPDGKGKLELSASESGPGCPRGYLDGQVYGVGYRIQNTPSNYIENPWNFVSCLLWDAWAVPDEPTWYRDIGPILSQYGNLYPIMSRHLVDLGDYDSVVKHRQSLIFCFELPVSDPNSMPVSRDLSDNKRQGILRWLKNVGPDGLPAKGTPEDRPKASAPSHTLAGAAGVSPQARPQERPPDPGGMLDYLNEVLKQQRGRLTKGGDES